MRVSSQALFQQFLSPRRHGLYTHELLYSGLSMAASLPRPDRSLMLADEGEKSVPSAAAPRSLVVRPPVHTRGVFPQTGSRSKRRAVAPHRIRRAGWRRAELNATRTLCVICSCSARSSSQLRAPSNLVSPELIRDGQIEAGLSSDADRNQERLQRSTEFTGGRPQCGAYCGRGSSLQSIWRGVGTGHVALYWQVPARVGTYGRG